MSELNKSPYISVNGGWMGLGKEFRDESSYMLKRIAEESGYQLLFGVQTSEKTQVYDIENRYGRSWYPTAQILNDTMDHEGSSVLHFNFETLTPDAVPLFAKLVYNNACINAFNYLKKKPCGIQLNRLPWHELDYTSAFEKISRVVPVSRVILQASGLQIGKLTPSEFAANLKPYSSYISTILIDDSSGTGKPLDPQQLRPYIEAVYGQPDMPSVAVAGGLNPGNVHFKLESLIADYPNLSVDAETGLRDNYDKTNPKISTFSSKKARDFVSKIIELGAQS